MLGIVSVFAILFLGKRLILEVVNIFLATRSNLGHFIEIAALIITR